MLLILPPDADHKVIDGLRDVRFQAVGTGPLAANIEEAKRRSFAGFDADSDGRISLKEYQVRQMTLLTNGFNRLDKDSDGAVTAAEYAIIGQPVLLTPDRVRAGLRRCRKIRSGRNAGFDRRQLR